ncbi:MAG: immunoglobulin domain-containing protein, partial [Phycisphaerae bacterium]
NPCGSVTSDLATLALNVPPAITSQPVSVATCVGSSAGFSVAATGTPPPTFQWQRNGVNIAGATASSFAILSVVEADGASYSCVVTNACGSVTSSVATLTARTAPVITTQPVAATPCPGSSATFWVVVSGPGPLSYQWRKAGVPISGATGPTYAILGASSRDVSDYSCVVTNSCGSVASSRAALTLGAAPSITSQPVNVGACPGGSATFQIVATGNGPLTYQWRKAGVNIAGATNAAFVIAAASSSDVASYSCVVANPCGSVTSDLATLALNVPAAITSQPVSVATCVGSSAGFSVAATGTPQPTFQWRRNGVNIAGATASTLAIPSVVAGDAAGYSCVVTNVCGSVTSSVATLTVRTAPAIVTQPASVAACLGRPATFSVGVTGATPLSYQWRRNGVNIPGATASIFSIAATSLSDLAAYSCVVANSCGSATTQAATLSQATVPVNDDISGELPLTIGVAQSGDTCAATLDSAAGQCDGQAVTAPGVWYRLAGDGTRITVSLCGSSFDTRLSIYCGDIGSPTCVAGNDNACGQSSSVTFCAQDGGTYHVLVHGAGGATGAFIVIATSDATPCSPTVRCVPVGACCTTDACEQLTTVACAAAGGTYLGDGTSCAVDSYAVSAASRDALPISIPDMSGTTPGQVSSGLRIRGSGAAVSSLAVSVGLTHASVGDLIATLRKDTTIVTLFKRVGGRNQLDGTYVFDDAATEPFADASVVRSPVAGGIYAPLDSLAQFNGMPLDGTWILTVTDQSPEYAGRIGSFSVGVVDRTPACGSCPSCAADYNKDGGVDFDDLGAFFDEWQASGGCADLNQDGGVDFGDLEAFMHTWEAGGC